MVERQKLGVGVVMARCRTWSLSLSLSSRSLVLKQGSRGRAGRVGVAADRVTDCRPKPPLGGGPFASPGACSGGGSAGGRGGACGVPACPLPASAASPVSLQLSKRQLLIPAVGASVLRSRVAAFFHLCYFFSAQNILRPQASQSKGSRA